MKKKYPVKKKASLIENMQLVLPVIFDDFMSYADNVINHPRLKRKLHEMRIACKPMRYLMEIMLPYFSKQFEECYDEIKKFLELSGDIHDCDVFAAEMQMHLKEMREFNRAVAEKISTKKIRELLKDLKAKRAKMFEKLCGVLKRWQRESFREKLIRWMEMRRGRMSVGGKTA